MRAGGRNAHMMFYAMVVLVAGCLVVCKMCTLNDVGLAMPFWVSIYCVTRAAGVDAAGHDAGQQQVPGFHRALLGHNYPAAISLAHCRYDLLWWQVLERLGMMLGISDFWGTLMR